MFSSYVYAYNRNWHVQINLPPNKKVTASPESKTQNSRKQQRNKRTSSDQNKFWPKQHEAVINYSIIRVCSIMLQIYKINQS